MRLRGGSCSNLFGMHSVLIRGSYIDMGYLYGSNHTALVGDDDVGWARPVWTCAGGGICCQGGHTAMWLIIELPGIKGRHAVGAATITTNSYGV